MKVATNIYGSGIVPCYQEQQAGLKYSCTKMEKPHKIGQTTAVVGETQEPPSERRKVIFSAIIAGFLIVLIWTIWLFEWFFNLDLHGMALEPRTLSGVPGILLEPLLHGSRNHIVSNSIPLFLLLTGALYFYRDAGLKALGWIWILTGLLVWCFGRPSLHIGASGIVYGLASFHAFSGFVRNDTRLMSVSLLTIFLYGSMIWGIFPIIPGVSWETHLMGGLSGLFAAVLYRKEGPQPRKYFEDEQSGQDEIPEEEGNQHNTGGIRVQYTYKPTESSPEDNSAT
jgi:membrane associated rhomboid family serine protease